MSDPQGPGDDLREAWRALIGRVTPVAKPAAAQVIGEELLARYAEPSRRYHNVEHLAEVLRAIDDLLDAGASSADPDAVRLAAWFHDAVYRGRPGLDEQESAELAATCLTTLGAEPRLSRRVGELVLVTARHEPATGDLDAELLCDADLAILGSSAERYTRYAKAVREEYSAVPNGQFRAARAAILEALLDAGPYRTDAARSRWHEQAARNVREEIDRLVG